MLKSVITISLCCITNVAYASEHDGWVDKKHHQTSEKIDHLADKMDDWFGESNPDHQASATLRVMVDTTWNKHDGLKIEPRVRGRVKLPTLEKKMSVVFGDDSLDNEALHSQHNELNPATPQISNQALHTKTTRKDNSSIALRWSNLNKHLGIDTDWDVGVRSGHDIYTKIAAKKIFQNNSNTYTQIEQMYRYGLSSKHFARTSAEIKHYQHKHTFIGNYAHIDYTHNQHDKGWTWGNTTYQQHQFVGNKRLNYGLQAGGSMSSKKHRLNSYGAFVSWRQPLWRDWLFVQTELTYANNKDEGRKHYVGAFARLEVNF